MILLRFFTFIMIGLLATYPVLAASKIQPTAVTGDTKPVDIHAPAVRVPIVGCRNYAGNGGGPNGEFPKIAAYKEVNIDAAAAKKLVYYTSPILSVLAPRGWHCIGISGTAGANLYVTPHTIKKGSHFNEAVSAGAGVIVRLDDGTTSGRFAVARVIARFFPTHKKFFDDVMSEGIESASDFPFGPYPNDKMSYRGESGVEIETPANLEGFGTEEFRKNNFPVKGVAILEHDGDDGMEGPFATLLYVRLEEEKSDLTSKIVHQFEAEK